MRRKYASRSIKRTINKNCAPESYTAESKKPRQSVRTSTPRSKKNGKSSNRRCSRKNGLQFNQSSKRPLARDIRSCKRVLRTKSNRRRCRRDGRARKTRFHYRRRPRKSYRRPRRNHRPGMQGKPPILTASKLYLKKNCTMKMTRPISKRLSPTASPRHIKSMPNSVVLLKGNKNLFIYVPPILSRATRLWTPDLTML